MKELSVEEFYENFNLVSHPTGEDISFDGCLIYPDRDNDSPIDKALIKAQKENRLLSVVDGDYDSRYIYSGRKIVNVDGYLITKEVIEEPFYVCMFEPMDALSQIDMVKESIAKAEVTAEGKELEDGFQQIILTQANGVQHFITESDDWTLNDMHDELCNILNRLING